MKKIVAGKYLTKIKIKLIKKFSTPEKYARAIGVKIGKDCNISTKDFSSESYLIEIGDYVRIARSVLFLTHGGIWSLRKKYPELKKADYFGKIKIGSYTYIGERAIIMPGVTIGENCIIGAATVVTKSIPPNSIVGGNPVKYIGSVDDFVGKLKSQDFSIKAVTEDKKREILLTAEPSSFVAKPYLKA
ncbi:MAG: acyltransferase [Bacteroidales bacterium]|jgi:acetyltransferase-like isoleucine patch superfamily enzyme|nr:acyltransferase [Bacteroidales bacterium]